MNITVYTIDSMGVYIGPVEITKYQAVPPGSLTPPPDAPIVRLVGGEWVVLESYPGPDLDAAKAAKNTQINDWRATANQTYFTHSGKQIACDALSRSDIDAVAGSIALNGTFPAGFPGAWKAMDNTYVMLPDVDAFKGMYASMTLQGTINFGQSQTLKTALAAATTIEEVNAIAWS